MVANQICAFESLCLLYGWYNLVAPNGYRILGLARYQLRIDHSCIHNCLLWQWCAPSLNVAAQMGELDLRCPIRYSMVLIVLLHPAL